MDGREKRHGNFLFWGAGRGDLAATRCAADRAPHGDFQTAIGARGRGSRDSRRLELSRTRDEKVSASRIEPGLRGEEDDGCARVLPRHPRGDANQGRAGQRVRTGLTCDRSVSVAPLQARCGSRDRRPGRVGSDGGRWRNRIPRHEGGPETAVGPLVVPAGRTDGTVVLELGIAPCAVAKCVGKLKIVACLHDLRRHQAGSRAPGPQPTGGAQASAGRARSRARAGR